MSSNKNLKCLFTDADWLFWELKDRKKKYNQWTYPRGFTTKLDRHYCKYCNFSTVMTYNKSSIFLHLFENHEKELIENDQDVNTAYQDWLKCYDPEEHFKKYGY